MIEHLERMITKDEANRIALRASRAILGAFHDATFTVEGVEIRIVAERIASVPWPSLDGLNEVSDGPWPEPVRVRCQWSSGSVDLDVGLSYWRTNDAYRHLVGLSVTVISPHRELVWITVPLALKDSDASEPIVRASVSPGRGTRQPGSYADPAYVARHVLRDVVRRAGLPFSTASYIEAFRIRVADGAVLPSPEVAFERLCHLALCKLPFFLPDGEGVNGALPFRSSDVVPEIYYDDGVENTSSRKRAGLWPLPGGVRQYKATLDALLGDLIPFGMELDRLYAIFRDRYDATGETSRKSYVNVLCALGLTAVADGKVAVTNTGVEYALRSDAAELFDRLHESFIGILEPLVLASELGTLSRQATRERMCSLLNVDWESPNQVNFRLNWLLSLGMTERDEAGDHLTDLGRRMLERYADEAATIRERVRQLIDEDALATQPSDPREASELVREEQAAAPGLDALKIASSDEPSAWRADRVDLRAERVSQYAKDLALPASTIARAVAALCAGKHLLLVGPPGTGKTELAHAIAEAARSEGYADGAFVATASADWTTFDTIGGYALQKDGALKFREGALLRAISQWQWLIVDELNRADVDRAFGELMTVLAGRATDTSFELEDNKFVRIGPDPSASHPMPKTFRVIATMNTWDKTSLFRLSYAVQRRFAIVHVGIPDDDTYSALLRKHATQPGPDSPLPADATDALVRLFSTNGLLAIRHIGPAVALDVIRYSRRRAADDGVKPIDALSEAVAMYVLPQLEGLEHERALRCHDAAMACVGDGCSKHAQRELRDRFTDLFPHVKLPSA